MERMTKDEFKKARKTLGITGDELADRLDVRPDTLRKWESGKQPIPYAVASELSAIAGDRIRELMEAANGKGAGSRELYGPELRLGMSVETPSGPAAITGIVETFSDPSRLTLDGWDVYLTRGGETWVRHLDKAGTLRASMVMGTFPTPETLRAIREAARHLGLGIATIDVITHNIRDARQAAAVLADLRAVK